MVKKAMERTAGAVALGYIFNDDYLDDILGDEAVA